MASALPREINGDLGTSPFYGQQQPLQRALNISPKQAKCAVLQAGEQVEPSRQAATRIEKVLSHLGGI